MKVIKNILVGFLVLILSAAIFFIMVKDQQVKDNILSSSLQMFGDDLLAMVPESEQKEVLRQKIDDFMVKADRNQVAPEEIEQVAADILNLTVQDTLLPPEEVIQIFELDEKPQRSVKTERPTQPVPPVFNKVFKRDRFKWGPPPQYKWDEKKKNALASQLQEMKDLHWEMQNLWQKDSTLKHLRRQVVFQADSGITVALDVNLKKKLNFESDEDLQKQIEKLERQQRLIWRHIPPPPPGEDPLVSLKFTLRQIPQLSQHLEDVGKTLILSGVLDSSHQFMPQNVLADSFLKDLEKELEKLEELELAKEKKQEQGENQ
ncbi:MAG TPA: hypothetical protein PLP19_05070 [bacterium]|nr:hypothetical protein [bacterium]HPN42841.1 hypothetical protein [bacterium]